MGYSEVQESDAAVSYSGPWAAVSDPRASGGTYKQSTTAGDTVTISFNGRALYLFTVASDVGSRAAVTLDGVAVGSVSGAIAAQTPLGGTAYVGGLVPLARGLSDGPHTLTLTNLFALALAVDSFVVVSGARLLPGAGRLQTMGDSWTTGVGAANASNAYPARLASSVAAALKRPVVLASDGVNGTGLFCTTATTTRSGGLAKTVSDVFTALPEIVTYLYGANDLRIAAQLGAGIVSGGMGVAAGDLVNAYRALCCLLEDVLDVTNAAGSPTPFRIVIATPGGLSSAQSYYRLMLAGVVGYPAGGLEQWEIAAAGIRALQGQFPWLRIADLYSVMDGRGSLIFPNSYADTGLHPNDDGHAVVAQELARAVLH